MKLFEVFLRLMVTLRDQKMSKKGSKKHDNKLVDWICA